MATRTRVKVTNTTAMAVTIAGKMLKGGASDVFDLDQVPLEWRAGAEHVDDLLDDEREVALIPAGTKVVAALSPGSIDFGSPGEPLTIYLDGSGGAWMYIDGNWKNLSADPSAVTQIVQAGMKVVQPTITNHILVTAAAAGNPGRMHIEPNGFQVGTCGKLDLMIDPYDPLIGGDQANYRILGLYTKSRDAADLATNVGNNGICVINVKGTGHNFGIWPALHVGFNDDAASGAVPLKLYYFDTSDTTWRTPVLGNHRAGIAVAVGDYVLANNKLYQASSAGTAGATTPSHASGTASDGAVNWDFVRDYAATTNSQTGCVVMGNRDDLPKFGLGTVRSQFSQDSAWWNSKKVAFLGNDNAMAWTLYSPAGGTEFRIEASSTAYLRFSKANLFYQTVGLAHLAAATTYAGAETTPSVAGTETLYFNNGAATTVTSFSGGKAFQFLTVQSANGNTTLAQGTNIKLKSGANVTLTANDCLSFQFDVTGVIAKQM